MSTRVIAIDDDRTLPVVGTVMSFTADDEHCWVYWEGAQETSLVARDTIRPYGQQHDPTTFRAATHVVIDTRGGFIFWRDEYGQEFNTVRAIEFAHARNQMLVQPTYRALALKEIGT